MAYVQHIAMIVRDLDATADFYGRVFGFRAVAPVRESSRDASRSGPPDLRVLVVTDELGHAVTLIEPHDGGVYRAWEYLTFGVNHMGIVVEDLAATVELLRQESTVTGLEHMTVQGNTVAKFRDLNGSEIDVADASYDIWMAARRAVGIASAEPS